MGIIIKQLWILGRDNVSRNLQTAQFAPLSNGCAALMNKNINKLPVKINKTKITKRHLNFLVLISDDGKTIIEKRTKNGIWKNLYQFPVVETKERSSLNDLIANNDFNESVDNQKYTVTLFNEDEIIHKLSHQHLYTSFWIVKLNKLAGEAIPLSKVHDFPVPILISRFIDTFGF